MNTDAHPAAPHKLPWFITAPGETDVLMVAMGAFLVAAVLTVGILFLRLHHLPDHIAHKGKKIQMEIVAVLGLLSLFTGIHVFWVAALLLAFVDIPDFGGSLGRMASSLEKIAGSSPPRQSLPIPAADSVMLERKTGVSLRTKRDTALATGTAER